MHSGLRWILFSVLILALWAGENLHAQVFHCQPLFQGLTKPAVTSIRLQEIQSSFEQAVLQPNQNLVPVLRLFRKQLEPTQSAIVTQFHEVSRLTARFSKWVAKDLTPLRPLLKSEKLDSKDMLILKDKVSSLEENFHRLFIEENEVSLFLQSCERVEVQVQSDLTVLRELKTWLEARARQNRLSITQNFILEVNSHLAILESQAKILLQMKVKLNEVHQKILLDRGILTHFFSVSWMRFVSEQGLWPNEITNLRSVILDEGQRDQAFGRSFYAGDRLVLVGRIDAGNRYGESAPLLSAVLERAEGTEGLRIRYKTTKNVHIIGSRKWGLMKRHEAVQLQEVEEIIHGSPNALLKTTGFKGEVAILFETPVESVREFKTSQEFRLFAVFRTFLANPNLDIDGFRIGQVLEIDSQRVFGSKHSPIFLYLLNATITDFFNDLNYKSFSLMKLDTVTKADLSGEGSYYYRRYVSEGKSILDQWKNEVGIRRFIKILGTNPLNDTVVVAFWESNTTDGSSRDPVYRLILRRDLQYLKTFDDLYFHWPILEGYDTVKDVLKAGS